MITSLIVLVSLISIGLIYGIPNAMVIDFALEIKYLKSPYYKVGISFEEHGLDDENFIEQQLTIGLFFISFLIIFYKENEEAA
jgi:hypothetical protein